jgi:phosphate transport system substrate-binding protein
MTTARLRPLHAIVVSVVCLGLVIGCVGPASPLPGAAVDPLAGHYTIKGGGSAMPAVKVLTDAFAHAHTGVMFNFEDIGSDAGLGMAAVGAIDLGVIGRELRPSESGHVVALEVGATATGAVVHADNPVHGLTRAQLQDVFAGRITDWAQVDGRPGRISVFIRELESRTHASFDAFIFGGKPEYTADAIEVSDREPMFNAVRGLKASIGMATATASSIADPSIHFLAIDGVAPTLSTIRSGSYPMRRPLYIVYRSSGLKPAVQAFLEYASGPEGQQLIAGLPEPGSPASPTTGAGTR